ARAHKYLFRAYYDTGELAKACESAQRYGALRPDDAGGHYSTGVVLAKLGQKDASERAFRGALAADPGHAKARRALHGLEAQPTPEPTIPDAAASRAHQEATPWPARIAAGLTVVASLAIIAWLFLPGGPANPGKPDVAPEPEQYAVVTPPPIQQTAPDPMPLRTPQPAPQPQVQPQPQPERQIPQPEPQPRRPAPQVTQPPAQPSPEQQQAIRDMQQQLQQLFAAYQQQQQDLQAANQRAQSAQRAADQAADQAAAQAATQAAAEAARAQQQAQAVQTPAPHQPQPGLQQPTPQDFEAAAQTPPTAMPPLLTADQARQVVEDMDAIDTAKTREAMWYSLDSLRAPYLQSTDVWGFVKGSLPMMLASSGTSLGTYEIVNIIQPSNTGGQAADILEQYTYDLQSVLPASVKLEIARTLANSQTPLDAWHGVDQLLRSTGVSTSVDSAAYLERALIAAQQTQMQRYRQSR
ncbi:MAG TPA: hypothetical protein QGH10_27740, partial [Armatimonadota bacterium]|nr:hypothetical protein [Armatimonadota bacterium]